MMVTKPLEPGPAHTDRFDKLRDINPAMTIHGHTKFFGEMAKNPGHDTTKGIKLTITHEKLAFCLTFRTDFSTVIPVFVTFS
jgi:hypothetical protein